MFYRCMRGLLSVLRRAVIRIRFVHKERIPKEGAYILCPNHRHALDPFPIAFSTRRQVHFMAKAELFKNGLLRWLINKLGSFKVDRDIGDISAIKTSLKLLKQGELLGVFPEGTRSKDGMMLPFHNGVAMIAVRAGVQVIPVGIAGNYKLWRKLVVCIGEPMDLSAFCGTKPSAEELSRATEAMRQAVEALVQEAEAAL